MVGRVTGSHELCNPDSQGRVSSVLGYWRLGGGGYSDEFKINGSFFGKETDF